MTTETWDVIIVGAGLAGLTAGATARAAGASVLVLDAHGPGGRARTSERDGYVLNLGAHALYRRGAGMTVLRALGIEPRGEPPPLHRYRASYEGELHRLPTSASGLLTSTLLSARAKVRLGTLLARLPRLDVDALAGTSAQSWLADQDLPREADALLRGVLRLNTYAGDLADFDAGAAIGQLQIGVAGGVLYLHGGWAQLIDALRRRVALRTGARVTGVEPSGGGVVVRIGDERLHARSVVLAVGTPAATQALLPAAPDWGDVGPPVTAACLDVAVRGVPEPGWVVGLDEPVYATRQGPPARQAPDGDAVLAVLRYGASAPDEDRVLLETQRRRAGVSDAAVVFERFLACMTVSATAPRATLGGLAGRPAVTATGSDDVFIAGDWVGPDGLLADAALASGAAAGRAAVRKRTGASTMVR